ncbi:MAG: ADP-ribosylglycohydrolase family protein [Spirochaetota bacterium]|nr:ADP-ribosylglycohydrolase family protein [Spirochaetota bacterium]
MKIQSDTVYGGIFGLAIGDALGVPVEFEPRETREADPVRDYREYGTHSQPKGTWSDDTSLTLALLDSLRGGLDYADIARKFLAWADNSGDYTATGAVFDIGNATSRAISRIRRGDDPVHCGGTDEYSNGNGSLMRILPAAFYVLTMSPEKRNEIVFNISAISHGHLRSKIACLLYTETVRNILRGLEKADAVDTAHNHVKSLLNESEEAEMDHFSRCSSAIAGCSKKDIRSDGYVVSSLEVSLWSFLTTTSYTEAVLTAVNLGHDTDTTAAITGGLAGCYYGYESLPVKWISGLQRSEYIYSLTEAFIQSVFLGGEDGGD